MPAYAWTPSTYNGVAINSGNLKSWFEPDNGPLTLPTVEPVTATVAGRGDVWTGAQPKGGWLELHVRLADVTQAILDEFYKTFPRSKALAYLKMTDGDSVAWRLAVQVKGYRIINALQMVVIFYAPDARWQEDTENSSSHAATAGDSHAFSLSVIGTEPAPLVFKVTPQAIKDHKAITESYRYHCRGYWYNRAERTFSDIPLLLTDRAGIDAPFNHSSIVKVSGVSNQINNIAGITSTATTIPIDTPVGGGLPLGGGIAYIDDATNQEQIYYTGNDGSNLTGCVRGIGGTTARAFADNVVIYLSKSLKNGDDVRVYYEGAEVPRWVDGTNTTTLRVWINVSADPGLSYTPAAAAASGVLPPTGGSITVVEDVDDAPVAGYLVWDTELIHYSSRAGKIFAGITRGAWGTTAASHLVTAPIWICSGRYIIVTGKGNAGPPPASIQRRPAIQLKASRNNKWYWGDQADDSLTAFNDPNYPNRTATWTPGYDADGNATPYPLVVRTATGTGSQFVKFNNSAPGENQPPENYVSIYLPQGIKQAASAITADWYPAAEELNMEMWGNDGTVWKLLQELQQAASVGAKTYTPTGTLYQLKLKARYNILTGFRGDDSTIIEVINNATNGEAADGAIGIVFTLDKDQPVKKFQVRLAKVTAGTQVLSCILHDVSGSGPGSQVFAQLSDVITVSGTTPTTYEIPFPPRLLRKAGTYWANFFMGAGFAPLNLYGYEKGSQSMKLYLHSTTWQLQNDDCAWFNVCSDYDIKGEANIQDDQPVVTPSTGARTATGVQWDKLILQLDDNASTPQTPVVQRIDDGADGGFISTRYYHINGVLSDAASPETLTFDAFAILGASLEVDSGTHKVTYTEAGVAEQLPAAISPSDVTDWMTLPVGTNAMTYTERGMANSDLLAIWRGRK